MVASGGGAVFDSSDLALPDSNQFRDVWLQVYIKEWIEYTFGGAISVKSTNVPVTMIEDTDFVNNFGDNGASISFDQGGGLYCIECRFRLTETESIDEKYNELLKEEAKMNDIFTGYITHHENTDEIYSANHNNWEHVDHVKASDILI